MPPKPSKRDDDLADILRKINEDPEYVKNLTDEQVIDIQSRIQPYQQMSDTQGVEDADLPHTCVSITNLRERYISRVKMTSMAGFMYAALTDYASWFDKNDDDPIIVANRAVIKQFLDNIMEFNPDKHVRPAAWENPDDPERPITPQNLINEMREELQKCNDTLASYGTDESLCDKFMEARGYRMEYLEEQIANFDAYANKKIVPSNVAMYKKYKPMEINGTFIPIPSYDVWRNWQRYEDQNYDRILELTNILYCEKPDLEFVINIHKTLPNAADADAYAKEIGSSVMTDVLCVQQGSWTYLGPFKANRQRLDFYANNTNILKTIQDSVMKDKALGNEMMKKKVTRVKKNDIVKHGAQDLKGINQYAKSMGGVSGQEPVLDDDTIAEINQLNESIQNGQVDAREFYENVDKDGVPLNAVTIDCVMGGVKPKVKRIYTEADKPTKSAK